MTVSAASSPEILSTFAPRQRDRRLGIGDLLSAVTRALAERVDPLVLRSTFEEMVRRLVPVRAVRLRDGQGRFAGRPDLSGGSEAIAFEIGGLDEASRGVLEARFDPPSVLGDWDFQLLGMAAHVGSLVLEIERCRGQLTRGSSASARGRRDEGCLIGATMPMETLRAAIERVADTDFTVLLEGESGVGKELVARQIHALSRRHAGPFVALNCAALVETLLEAELFGIEERTATGVRGRRGKFEHADGGTLFLDEVSDLSLSAQAKLLRAIQDLAVERVGATGTHRVDIRIVAATNRGLKGLVDQKLFRPDLYYRLSGVDLRVPPLRERRADISDLARHFLDRHRSSRSLRLSPAAADALRTYDWPGNVRELERLIERTVALSRRDVIELDDLPPAVRGEFAEEMVSALESNRTMRAWTSRYARLMLDKCKGNKRETCRMLGISYHTLVAYLNHGTNGPTGGDEAPADAASVLSEASECDVE